MHEAALTPTPITLPSDVMFTGREWKYMTHVLPDKGRPLREDASVAFGAFLKRLHTVWHQRTRGAGNARHVEAMGDGERVRVHFQLHDLPARTLEFATTRMFRGMGEANKIVDLVIQNEGGIQAVLALAEDMTPVVEVPLPMKKPRPKTAIRKAKKTVKKKTR